MTRSGKGSVRVNLNRHARELLARVPPLLREVASADAADPASRRMFPPAYDDDESWNARYALRAHEDLARKRLAAAETIEETATSEVLTEEQARNWLDGCNDARLILGSGLAITEDMSRSDVPPELSSDFEVYEFLSFLVGRLVVSSGGPEQDELAGAILIRMEAEEEAGEGN